MTKSNFLSIKSEEEFETDAWNIFYPIHLPRCSFLPARRVKFFIEKYILRNRKILLLLLFISRKIISDLGKPLIRREKQ